MTEDQHHCTQRKDHVGALSSVFTPRRALQSWAKSKHNVSCLHLSPKEGSRRARLMVNGSLL